MMNLEGWPCPHTTKSTLWLNAVQAGNKIGNATSDCNAKNHIKEQLLLKISSYEQA